jgi:hypothetical protein
MSQVPEVRTDFRCPHVFQVHTNLTGDTISKPKIGRGNLGEWRFTTSPACEAKDRIPRRHTPCPPFRLLRVFGAGWLSHEHYELHGIRDKGNWSAETR